MNIGGHLTHGFYTYSKADNCRKAVSATSVYFESLPYRVHPQSGMIDYDALAAQVNNNFGSDLHTRVSFF